MKRILFLLFLAVGIVSAQEEEQNFYDGLVSRLVNIPNSPEAQAFAKYGDTEVSLYSGVPQISVPLHTIEGREMSLPVSITYDASGIKVEQLSTPIGLGWNLQVGGRISRMVNGLPDDYDSGEYGTIYNNYQPQGPSSIIKDQVLDYATNQNKSDGNTFSSLDEAEEFYEFMFLVNNNHIDSQPDYYSLNVPGISETLVVDYTDNNVVKALNNPRIKITRYTGINNTITGWQVTNEDGTVYNFDTQEKTFRQNTTADGTTSGPGGTVIGQGDANTTYNSSWLLTSIVSPNGKDTYVFSYTNLGYWTQEEGFSAAGVSNMPIVEDDPNHVYPYPQVTSSGVIYNVEQQLLSSIEHNGKVLLSMEYGNRDDVNYGNGINAKYSALNIYDFEGGQVATPSTLKRIEFNNDTYFNSDDWNDYRDIRLKLDGITIKGNDGLSTYETYEFEYERPNEVPSRICTGQDYWGYYNGNCGQNIYQAVNISGVSFQGGNRHPSSFRAKTGILNKITYPTKGYTVFDYEGHKENGADIGGLRIRSIVDYANTELPALTKTYSYSGANKNERVLYQVKTVEELGTQMVRYASVPQGSQPYVTYTQVTETRIDNNGQNSGSTTYEFYNGNKGVVPSLNPPFENRFTGDLEASNVRFKTVKDKNGNELTKEDTEYYEQQQVLDVPGYVIYIKEEFLNKRVQLNQNGSIFSATTILESEYDACWQLGTCPPNILSQFYNAIRGKKTQALGQYGGINKRVTEQTLVDASGTSQTVTTTQDIVFTSQDDGYGNVPVSDNMYLPRKIRTTDSKGDTYETTKFYFQDFNLFSSKNNFTEVVEENTVEDPDGNPTTISEQQNEYASSVMSPTKVITVKDNIPSDRAEFTYYSNGNLQTAKQSNGPTTVYLWGYDDRYPVAKIENASVTDIQALASFTSTLDLGDGGLSQTQEDDLRGLQGALVTTYDYKPLVGVKTITDYRGFKTEFEYDDFNRLQWIKDEQGNLLNDYDYGYATPIQN